MSQQPIKVVLGRNVTRTAVLINPNTSASDNTETGAQSKNIIASGASTMEVLKKIHGKR